MTFAGYIPWLPALAALLCGICCTRKALRPWAAVICIAGLGLAFLCTLLTMANVQPVDLEAWAKLAGNPAEADSLKAAIAPYVVTLWTWIKFGGLDVGFSYFIDPLTVLMLCVVTGIGTLVAIYAAGYMKGDPGYARFFMAVSLFIFAMTTLVMADNLVLIYLGWEGVGLCSYLLIGYYYQKPSAVAAAKKAFIVNRIGDLGFALGIFLIYLNYGTVHIPTILAEASAHDAARSMLADQWIPFLLMLGAFGKSAQIPLYIWLPDAMEGPTPVSALIHAATMVTAGVYLIARLMPVFELSPYALPTVAVIGGLTSIFAATMALCQYDIKRIYAYSTISQLGYMFVGVGAFSAFAGVFHLFTHAFFKALLFLTAGSVMHALAGQLDLRKMSGLRTLMPVTCWLMFVGCLSLSAVPFITAGFYSKDAILIAALDNGLGENGSMLYLALGLMGLFTAVLTAFYTFRLWFRVFMGETKYEMGDEHGHGHDDDHAHSSGHASGDDHSHAHAPHEMPWLMNAPLLVLAVGAIATGWLGGWVTSSIEGSTAVAHHHPEHGHILGMSTHAFMIFAGIFISVVGIGGAAYYHWINRAAADRVAGRYRGIVKLLENKYYVDEIYDALIVRPLRGLGQIFFVIDRIVIDGLVLLVGFLPRLAGLGVQPSQRGVLHGYGLGMAVGVAVVVLIVVWKL